MRATGTSSNVVIIGAGLAGLCCARRLQHEGVDCTILEASDGVGGRVRTDSVDGFLLDRGFQVLLTAYPECREILDYASLDLRPFAPGALIRIPGRFCRLSDPWRKPSQAVATVFSPAATLTDKLRVGRLRRRLRKRELRAIFEATERTTRDYLRDEGFSSRIVDRFFKPFLGGVFLEAELETSSRMFEFLFKMFATGDVAVPNSGMQAVPESIAADLRPGTVRTGCSVERIQGGVCTLTTGEEVRGRCVVVATNGRDAARLIGRDSPDRWNGTTCLYYDAPRPPIDEAVLVLNGEGRGPLNSVTVLSQIAEGYAPEGRALVSASLLGNPDGTIESVEPLVRQQLSDWFGAEVTEWRYLRGYTIPRALPSQPPGTLEPAERPVRIREDLYVCGDHVDQGSIQGAMVSGRRAAEALLGRAARPVE